MKANLCLLVYSALVVTALAKGFETTVEPSIQPFQPSTISQGKGNEEVLTETTAEDDLDARADSNFLYNVVDDQDNETLAVLAQVEDDIFFGKLALRLGKMQYLSEVKQREKITLPLSQHRNRRQIGPIIQIARRVLPTVVRVVRNVFRSSTFRSISRSGSRVTRQYESRLTHAEAEREFNRLPLSNRATHHTPTAGRVETGTVGSHRVTLREGSSEGSPTLEVRSHNGDSVRKYRLDSGH